MSKRSNSTKFEIFPWNSNFNVGIDLIDRQHRKLVDLLNNVIWHFVTFRGRHSNSQVLGELVAYARYHFHEEELLWRKYFGRVSIASDHYKTHHNFFTKIEEIQSLTSDDEPCTDKLIEFLTNWLAVHILHSDRTMAAMVQEIDSNGVTIAEAEKIAKEKIKQTPVLSNSIVSLYNKLSSSAAELIRERNARLNAESQLQETLKQKAEHALEAQALEYQKHLEFLAYYDPLTGLLNRNGLIKELNKVMAKSTGTIAAISIDLDYFSQIGSQLSSEGTTRLLGILARRWQDALLPHGALAHMGGDDFVVLVNNADLFESQLNAFYLAASQPFHIDQWQSTISFTAGVSLYSSVDWESKPDPAILLRQADYALFQAKQECRGSFYIFDAAEDKLRQQKNSQIAEMRKALANDEFILFYQPKVQMKSGEVIGLEALIRWQHPDRGLLPPDEFLPLLDRHPLIIDVGEWVIRRAIEQLLAWDESGLSFNVSVNADTPLCQDTCRVI